MLRIYYSSPIDVCVEKAFKTIELFKKIFAKFPELEVYGAGFGKSPIITSESTWSKKKAIVAYDYRIIRSCDILFVNTDLDTFCAGTMLEMEYARQLGMFIILMCPEKPKNIFLETLADKIVYSIEQLEEILKELIQ
jgi:nucleoside 2-deoxyribosyltransferase